jgi:ParB family chromosome partitioning protein
MPEPLASGLHMASMRDLYTKLTGKSPGQLTSLAETCPASRLPLLMLAPVVVAYEHALTSDAGKGIWRTDRQTSSLRPVAGRYLAFLATAGYQLSGIEQAVADDATWPGDPAPQAASETAANHQPGLPGQPAVAGAV